MTPRISLNEPQTDADYEAGISAAWAAMRNDVLNPDGPPFPAPVADLFRAGRNGVDAAYRAKMAQAIPPSEALREALELAVQGMELRAPAWFGAELMVARTALAATPPASEAIPLIDVEPKRCRFVGGLDDFTNCAPHGWSGTRDEVKSIRVCPKWASSPVKEGPA